MYKPANLRALPNLLTARRGTYAAADLPNAEAAMILGALALLLQTTSTQAAASPMVASFGKSGTVLQRDGAFSNDHFLSNRTIACGSNDREITIPPQMAIQQQVLFLDSAFSDLASREPSSVRSWVGLACARLEAIIIRLPALEKAALLMPAGASWASGAAAAATRAVALDPADSAALNLLVVTAVLKAQHEDTPVTAPGRYRGPSFAIDADAAHDVPVAAAAVYAAVRAGHDASSVLAGCTTLMMAAHDFAAAHDCTSRGLARGADSTWYLLRLAWLAFQHDDTLGGRMLFNSAVGAAHSAEDRAQIGWHLQAQYREEEIQAASDATGRARQRAQWDSAGKERRTWLALPDSELITWVRARAATPKGAQLWDSRDSTLAKHFRSIVVDADRFYVCRPSDQVPPCAHPDARTHSVLQARRYRLWNPATGALVAVMPFTIDVEGHDTTRVATVAIRQANSGHDTTIAVPLTSRGRTSGVVVEGTAPRSESWNVVALFGSAQRRAGDYGDAEPAIGAGVVAISDLVVSSATDTMSAHVGDRLVIMTPFARLSRKAPLHLYYQLRSTVQQSGLSSTTAIYRMDKFGHRGKPLISFQSPLDLRSRGIVEVDRDLDTSRLDSGDYELEVQILDSAGRKIVARGAAVHLR